MNEGEAALIDSAPAAPASGSDHDAATEGRTPPACTGQRETRRRMVVTERVPKMVERRREGGARLLAAATLAQGVGDGEMRQPGPARMRNAGLQPARHGERALRVAQRGVGALLAPGDLAAIEVEHDGAAVRLLARLERGERRGEEALGLVELAARQRDPSATASAASAGGLPADTAPFIAARASARACAACSSSPRRARRCPRSREAGSGRGAAWARPAPDRPP